MQKSLNLLSERHKLGLTQVQLAELLDITPEYLSMIENGRKNPSSKILNKLDELIIRFNKSPSDSASHRLADLYKMRQTTPDLVCEYKNSNHLEVEIDRLRSELRDARAVIRDQAAALAALAANKPGSVS